MATAAESLNRFDAHRFALSVDEGLTDARTEVLLEHDDLNRGSPGAEQLAGVGGRALPQQLGKNIRCQLLSRARVVEDAVSERCVLFVDEAHPAELGRGGAVVDVFDGGGVFWSDVPREPRHSVRPTIQPQRALLAQCFFAIGDAGQVEPCTNLARSLEQSIWVERRGLFAQLRGGCAEFVGRHACAEQAEARCN